MQKNEVIEQLAQKNIPLWRLAAEVGISEGSLIRWLRFPLSGEREDRVRAALGRLIGDDGNE